MNAFADWLAAEAGPAGAIGPNEVSRIDLRHLADSVLFATEMAHPESLWDLGTGVGLPGVPLAVLMPETQCLLVDRSRRRIDLLTRVIRILGLENCQPIQGDIADLSGMTDTIVARASLSPDQLYPVARRHLNEGGLAVVGGSWNSPPTHANWETKEIPVSVLDQPVWLLMMRQS